MALVLSISVVALLLPSPRLLGATVASSTAASAFSTAMSSHRRVARLAHIRASASAGDVATTPPPVAWASWQRAAWDATAWDDMPPIDKHRLLQQLLDGGLSVHEANHVAWRGLGYTLAVDGETLLRPDGAPCESLLLPDVLADPAALSGLEVALQEHFEERDLDDEDELESLNVLIETLHGEALTRALLAEGDADFIARRTLVCWLYTTQPGMAF